MSEKFCPKCGDDISESYAEDDPDVGIYGGWYCEKCDHAVPQEDYDEQDWEYRS